MYSIYIALKKSHTYSIINLYTVLCYDIVG